MFASVAVTALVVVLAAPGTATAQEDPDPRVGLEAGWLDAETAIRNLEFVAHHDKPEGFVDPANPGNFGFVTSDMAFSGNHAFVGNFHGFNVYDISDPADPTIVTNVVCPGGQGDLSVHGDLLFMSVEESRARVDCGTDPTVGTRFQGVRIFDISDVANPVQVATVQLCRGSHTHSLVTDPDDPENVWVYVSGTAGVRPATTLAGCNNNPPTGENPSRWRIEIIKVPLAAPETAAVVSEPRLFTNPQTGAIDGLQNTLPTPTHPSGAPWGPSPITDACHDITAFPEIGLAAGACEGNGILIDISDPENPVRIDEVSDPNFAYWHSATLSNDGTKVIFTDEWGGGTGARCRETDQPQWGADAIFDIVGGQMEFKSYYKLPVTQTTAGELRRPQRVAPPGAGARHPRPGLVPGRHLARGLHRLRQPGGDRLLRPGTDQRHVARPRRVLVGVLVQRQHLRQRDRPWVRRVQAAAERSRHRGGDRCGR